MIYLWSKTYHQQTQPRKKIDWPQGHNGPNGRLEGLYQDCE
jgi:hypothetical protein